MTKGPSGHGWCQISVEWKELALYFTYYEKPGEFKAGRDGEGFSCSVED